MIQPAIIAFQFLTRFPIPVTVPFTDENLRKSIFFFPWVGMVLGLILGGVGLLLPKEGHLYGYLLTLLWVGITGAMHLDGVSDTFDGFFSGRERSRILDIMKDSRLGSFGAIGLILLLAGKILMLSEVPKEDPFFLGFLLSGARLANGFVIALFPGARPGGMGEMFQKTKPLPYISVSAILYLLFISLYRPIYLPILFSQAICIFAFALYSNYKIGGVTGDIYGADVELGELLGLIVGGLYL